MTSYLYDRANRADIRRASPDLFAKGSRREPGSGGV